MAAIAAVAPTGSCPVVRIAATRAAAALVLILSAATAGAQGLYRYTAADGHRVYTDQIPTLTRTAVQPVDEGQSDEDAVWLREAVGDAGQPELVAVNDLASWAQVAYRLDASRNLDPLVSRSGNFLLPPLSETPLIELAPIDDATPAEISVSYQYVIGHPGARHRPDSPYRLPYPRDEAYRVSQAYPDTVTHSSPGNRYAYDFEMPVGTTIVAARDGIVVEARDEFFGAGVDLERQGDRANLVRILHDDGTFALYGHLRPHSIRVTPGQRVSRGQPIADSGNTGYSTGPHLHFVVQLNRAGATESVPVTFEGAAGIPLRPVTGDRPAAY